MSDFDVGAFLGRGGFASVYRAIDRFDGSAVALKVVDVDALEAAGVGPERLAREVALQTACDSEHIVRCRGAFVADGAACAHLLDESWEAGTREKRYACVVLELCRGGDLRDLVRRRGPVREAEGARLLRGVLKGLAYLHARGVAHRDVKLANVLLDGSTVKLCDFGVAARVDDDGDERRTLCGTPNYIAPEVVDKSPHGSAVDVYGVGCLAHALLTGRPAPHAAESRRRLGGTTPPRKPGRLDLADADLSAPAKAFVLRCLRRSPDERPTAAEALRDPFLDATGGRHRSADDTAPQSAAAWGTTLYAGWERSAAIAGERDGGAPPPLRCGGLRFECSTPRQRVKVERGVARLECAVGHRTIAAIRVSRDGERVALSVIENGAKKGVKRYARADLPARFAPLYAHLARCVSLAASRTPKVVAALANGGTCALMSNGPLADARLLRKDGTAGRYSLATGRFEVARPDGAVVAYAPSSPGAPLPETAPAAWVEAALRETRGGVRACLAALKRRPDGPFPLSVTVRPRPKAASPVSVAQPTSPPPPPKHHHHHPGSVRSNSSRTTAVRPAHLSFVSDLTATTAGFHHRSPRRLPATPPRPA